MKRIVLLTFLIIVSLASFGKDIELFFNKKNNHSDIKNQLLITFNNADSLDSEVYVKQRVNSKIQDITQTSSNDKNLRFIRIKDGKQIKFNDVIFNVQPYGTTSLATITQWMNTHDAKHFLEDKQTSDVFTLSYTKGIGNLTLLLNNSASLGQAKYFYAKHNNKLIAVLFDVLNNFKPSNYNFTSAAVAVNSFDRRQTLNSIYYASVQASNSPRWQGNLKKYKVINGLQVGKYGEPVFNTYDGSFSEKVSNFWLLDNVKNGVSADKGGVAELLRNKNNRIIYSDVGTMNNLERLTTVRAKYSFGGGYKLAVEMGVKESEIQAYLDWAMGLNIDQISNAEGNIPFMRPDVFADPLHSTPLVINYGSSIRLLIGTNAGVLHMFEDKGNTVDENWAFMPKEFFKNIKSLRRNYSGQEKIYGIDGQITSHIEDFNGDGIINGSDKVWIFFGLGRGGTSYYALDISKPNKPKKMWHISNNTAGFSELGQSWSRAKIAYSKANIVGVGENAVAIPVLFFAGGYDISKDNKLTTNADDIDNSGKAIYMVDAKSGALKWSLTPSGGTTVFSGTDSIPSNIAILDSDGDGLTDRLYVGDTGGNIWRVDMPSANPKDPINPWTVFKLAVLGGKNKQSDLKFFNEPAIVRSIISETIATNAEKAGEKTDINYSQQEIAYDVLLIGSGDKTDPIAKDTNNAFFMIKDKHVQTQSFDNRARFIPPLPISKNSLYNYTSNPYENIFPIKSDSDQFAFNQLSSLVSKSSGWMINLGKNTGEKSTSEAIVINGEVYFTTFIPNDVAPYKNNRQGILYAVDLIRGTAVYNRQEEMSTEKPERATFINEQFLAAPTLMILPENDKNSTNEDDDIDSSAIGMKALAGLNKAGAIKIIVGGKIIPIGSKLKTMRTFLYIKE